MKKAPEILFALAANATFDAKAIIKAVKIPLLILFILFYSYEQILPTDTNRSIV